MKRTFAAILALAAVLLLSVPLLGGCGKAAVPDDIDDNYRVFYEIFVGSFSDSDGDGCGDLRGIINRMDYLNDGDTASGKSLGVQGIWLSPVFSSPSYHKYDVADYYKTDEAFGTSEDLAELFNLCESRNVKVILDLPINHTSSANLMFQKFVNAHKSGNTDDMYHDFYVHCTQSERLGGHTYSTIPGCAGEYYECNFSTDMPELDFDNAAVRQYVLDVAKYYLDMGADGFRFDAVKYVYYSDTAKSSAFFEWYMDELRKIKSDIYCVGECWSADAETLEYAGALNCFDFQMAQSEGFTASAAKGGYMSIFTSYVESFTKKLKAENESAMLIPFLSNHDMDRSAGYVTLASKRAYMAANLYILCSGSPFIYYGEEIGMKGSRGASNTDANRRLAMLWGDGDTVKDPTGTTYDPSKQTNGTVSEQIKDKDSLYNHYAKLIALRGKYPEIARGEYKALTYGSASFGGFLISYGEQNTGLFHNTSDGEVTVDISEAEGTPAFAEVCDYIGQGKASLDGNLLTIGPQTSAILK